MKIKAAFDALQCPATWPENQILKINQLAIHHAVSGNSNMTWSSGDSDWVLTFCCHEFVQFRSWPFSSPSMSNTGWSALLWLSSQPPTKVGCTTFLVLFYSPTAHLLPRACHLQMQSAKSPALLALLQYLWTNFTYQQSSSHHLYSEVDIDRRGISLEGERREGHSRARHRLKKHTEEMASGSVGWGCSLRPNTVLPLGFASSEHDTPTTHQAFHMRFFRYLLLLYSKFWLIETPAFSQAQNLIYLRLSSLSKHSMSTIYINTIPKWSWIHSLLSVPPITNFSCIFHLDYCRIPVFLPKFPLLPK